MTCRRGTIINVKFTLTWLFSTKEAEVDIRIIFPPHQRKHISTSARNPILLFHMCFGIRILNPFHLTTQIVSIQNLNCPKTHALTWFLEWSSIHVKCCSIFAKFSSMNVEFIQHPYPTSPIFIKCLLRKVKFQESKVIKCMNIICIKFNFLIAEPWLPSSTWSGDKNHVRACVFSVFRTVKVLNGYNLSG